MTLTFNQEKYKQLLVTYVPKIIKTEAENEKALEIIEELMNRKLSPEEDELYQLLITLVEKFEQEFYQIDLASNPLSILQFLLSQSAKSKIDLIKLFDSEILVNKMLQGKANITPQQAIQLGNFFHVSPDLFTNPSL
jgi:HTH-type transcriptional regulator/antitoxin HigA